MNSTVARFVPGDGSIASFGNVMFFFYQNVNLSSIISQFSNAHWSETFLDFSLFHCIAVLACETPYTGDSFEFERAS
jgi:hypothetical protein